MHISYGNGIPNFIQEWKGVYETTTIQKDKAIKQAFRISNNCFNDEIMGEFICEVEYSKNNSAFDDWEINFYTEKPNDMNYSIVRIISIESPTKATIKVFSMEYSNDFCNIDVKKQNKIITLIAGNCKINDFVLHNDIFKSYEQIKY